MQLQLQICVHRGRAFTEMHNCNVIANTNDVVFFYCRSEAGVDLQLKIHSVNVIEASLLKQDCDAA